MDDVLAELFARCEDELTSPADAALLASRFANTLSEESVLRAPLDVAVDCRSFVEGAIIAAQRDGWDWSVEALVVVAELAAHHGLAGFPELATRIHERDPRSTRAIALWAESATHDSEVVGRYIRAMETAESPAEIESLARRYVEHSPNVAELRHLFDRLSSGN